MFLTYFKIFLFYLLLHLSSFLSFRHACEASRSKEFKMIFKKMQDYHKDRVKLSALWPFLIVRDVVAAFRRRDL